MARAKTKAAPPVEPAPASPAAALSAAKPGLRVRPQRPMRALVGGLVVLAAVAAALALFASIGDREQVLALSDTVLAGEQIGDSDLRVVSVGSDEDLSIVPASQRAWVVGQYARYRLAPGSFLVSDMVQPRPLVSEDRVLVSVAVPVQEVPSGLREQSRVTLAVTPGEALAAGSGPAGVVAVEATVVAVPGDLAQRIDSDASANEMVSLSVEIEPRFLAVVTSAAAIGVGVVPTNSPAPGSDDTASPSASPAESVPAADASAGSTPPPGSEVPPG